MEISQDDRNLGMLVHGLVGGSAVLAIIPVLNMLSFLAFIAVVVMYFVFKQKSPWVQRHAKQAAGFVVALFVVGLVLSIIGGAIGAAAVSSAIASGGRGMGVGLGVVGLIGLVGLAINIAVAVLGFMGLAKANKGEEYTYPLVGKYVDGLKI